MKRPQLSIVDQVEMCDGHADYGTSILYCEIEGAKKEIFRTGYRTNRWHEQMEGILSFTLDRIGQEWLAILELEAKQVRLHSRDGRNWQEE